MLRKIHFRIETFCTLLDLCKMYFHKEKYTSAVKIANKFPHFGGLVLGCIEADLCRLLFMLQHFSSSTRFAHFCTAQNSENQHEVRMKINYFGECQHNVQHTFKFCNMILQIVKIQLDEFVNL